MTVRRLAGYVCIVVGFALILLLGYGVIDPIGGSAARAASMGALMAGLVPSVLMALGAFVIGLWLLKGRPRDRNSRK
jgi:hypothetical protein